MTHLLRGARAAGTATFLDVRWDEGVVRAIGPAGSLTAVPGEVVHDLAGAFLAPGLVDAHVHLSRPVAPAGSAGRPPGATASIAAAGAAAAAHGEATLAAGVTTVRDLGAPDGACLAPVPGGGSMPRVVAAGRALTRAGCYGGFLGVGAADGAELEALARAEVAAGVRVLKVILTGPVDFARGTAGPVHFDEPDLRRVAVVAREAGIPLAVHANGHAGVSLALRVGAASLEHGILLEEEDLRSMASLGTVWVPTLTPLYNLRSDERWPELGGLYARHSAMVARGAEMGVSVAAGSDAGSPGVPHPSLFTEIGLLRRAGFDAVQAGCAAGSTAAALLGLSDGQGRLEQGASTDLVWFAHDPYEGDPGPPAGMLRTSV